MKEQEINEPENIYLVGNHNIPTSMGFVSIDINAILLRNELVQAVDQEYEDPFFRQRGREIVQRLGMVFHRQALIDFLVPIIEGQLQLIDNPKSFSYKYLEAHRDNILGRLGQASGSFFFNPIEPKEGIFFINIPVLVGGKQIKSVFQLFEEYRHLWLHERHHFVQNVDGKHNFILSQQQELLFGLWAIGMGGLAVSGGAGGYTAAGYIGEKIDYFRTNVSRRNLLKTSGAVGGTSAGIFTGLIDLWRGIEYLNYRLPITTEGQAEAAAHNANYTIQDLQKTFDIRVSV